MRRPVFVTSHTPEVAEDGTVTNIRTTHKVEWRSNRPDRRSSHQPSTLRFQWKSWNQLPWWFRLPINLAMMAGFALMCTAPFWAWVAGLI